MTSQIFKLMVISFTAFATSAVAQPTSCSVSEELFEKSAKPDNTFEMELLIHQSLLKVTNSPETIITCISEMERIATIFPDSIAPIFHIALQSLNFAVQNPQSELTPGMIDRAQESINKMEQNKNYDISDIFALHGFLYMTKIVQNPIQNGALYYHDVMEYYEKALKINPDNALARQLYEKFKEGMRRAGL